jgi:site-specific recombinase XerD
LKGSLRTTQRLICHPDPLLDERTGLDRYLQTLHSNDRLFPITRFGFAYIMKKHCAAGDIPRHKAHVHTLKHSCAMTAVRSGVENARQYLGHRSLNSTGAYLRVSDEEASQAFANALCA